MWVTDGNGEDGQQPDKLLLLSFLLSLTILLERNVPLTKRGPFSQAPEHRTAVQDDMRGQEPGDESLSDTS